MSGRGLGWSLLALALLLYSANVLRFDPVERGLATQWPWPDGAEYLDSGLSLAREGRFVIQVAGDHPPRYPFGFPVLVAAALLIGAEPAEATFFVNRYLGVALLLGVFGLMAGLGKPAEGGLAALLVASTPALTILARSPMSDLAGAAVVFAAVAALVVARHRESSAWAAAGSFLLGASLCFRLANVFWAPLLPAMLLSATRVPKDVVRRALPLSLAYLLGAAPLIGYNAWVLGGPLKTGYGFWLTETVARPFHWSFLGRNLTYWWTEWTQSEVGPSTAFVYGQGSYYGPFALLLLVVVAPVLWRRRHLRWILLGSCVYPVALLFYSFSLGRLYLTAFVPALTAAAFAVGAIWRTGGPRRRAFLVLLVLVTVVGYPGRRHGSDLSNMWRLDFPLRPNEEWDLTQDLSGRMGPQGGLILTDISPPFVHALIPQAIVAPLQDDHDYRFRPENFRFFTPERNQLVERVRAEGKPVFALTQFLSLDRLDALVPPPAGDRWTLRKTIPHLRGIAELVRATDEDDP